MIIYSGYKVNESYKSHPYKVVYDDIVDRKDFSKLKNQKRLERLSEEGAGAFSGTGVYDFEVGTPASKIDHIPDSVKMLRSGKLDRPDFDTISSELQSQGNEILSKTVKERRLKERELLEQERQKFLDNQVGFLSSDNITATQK